MRYAIIEGDKVINVAVADAPLEENWIEAGDQVGPGWLYVDGEFQLPPVPPVDPAVQKERFRKAVQDHIDATAQSRNYDNGMALAGYVNSTIPPWRAEAEAFIAWRDQVWLFVFEKLAQVEAGEVEPPESADALIGWLPQIEWPE